jgi:hypothetical protein
MPGGSEGNGIAYCPNPDQNALYYLKSGKISKKIFMANRMKKYRLARREIHLSYDTINPPSSREASPWWTKARSN